MNPQTADPATGMPNAPTLPMGPSSSRFAALAWLTLGVACSRDVDSSADSRPDGDRADADDCPCVLSHEDPAFARANLSLPCVCKGLNDCLPLDEVTGGDFCSHHFQVIRHTFAGCGLVSLNWYLGAGTETHVFEVPSGKLVGVFLSDDLPIVMCNGEDAWSKRGGRFPEDEGCVESSLETICVPDAG